MGCEHNIVEQIDHIENVDYATSFNLHTVHLCTRCNHIEKRSSYTNIRIRNNDMGIYPPHMLISYDYSKNLPNKQSKTKEEAGNMIFEEQVGKKFNFYGVCNYEFKLDDTVWEAKENPDDGYRSYLGSIEVKESAGIFFIQPLAEVEIVAVGEDEVTDGYRLVDVIDGHVWVEVGTDHTCNYYPYFVFNYFPKTYTPIMTE
jgi:hypothetical protein